MNKKIISILTLLLLISGIFFLYQFPYKKYIAQQKLYILLSEEGIDKEDVQINKILIDLKSARVGYTLFFNVNKSTLNYQYDYYFNTDTWFKTYEENGFILRTEKIIFDIEKENRL